MKFPFTLSCGEPSFLVAVYLPCDLKLSDEDVFGLILYEGFCLLLFCIFLGQIFLNICLAINVNCLTEFLFRSGNVVNNSTLITFIKSSYV